MLIIWKYLWVGLFLATTNVTFSAEKTKVLLIGKAPDHPYGSHMYLHTCRMLAKCLKQTANTETVVSNGWPQDQKFLKDVKTIVVYTSPAAELLLDSPHRDQVQKLLNNGVGLVTIHWASSIYQKNYDRLGSTWLDYLGGTWISNVGLSGGKSTLRQLAKHPIFRGWDEYEIRDEYYLNPVIANKATPLLQVREKNGQDVIVGWAFERENGGRSFATTLGHSYERFQNDSFRRMIVNAILWTAWREVPETGAPVGMSTEDLALPPKGE